MFVYTRVIDPCVNAYRHMRRLYIMTRVCMCKGNLFVCACAHVWRASVRNSGSGVTCNVRHLLEVVGWLVMTTSWMA